MKEQPDINVSSFSETTDKCDTPIVLDPKLIDIDPNDFDKMGFIDTYLKYKKLPPKEDDNLETRVPLGTRMKAYEHEYREKCPTKVPVVVRINGKAFHSFTRGCEKPFDYNLASVFVQVCEYLIKEIQCTKLIYHQSDEISIILSDMDTEKTEPWFNNNTQKIASVAASMATYKFNQLYEHRANVPALFDARVSSLPFDEVPNYIIWRQKDWLRNSVSMFARSYFSQKQLHGKSVPEVLDMCQRAGCDWDTRVPEQFKYGTLLRVDKRIIPYTDNGSRTSVSDIITEMTKLNYETLSKYFNKSHGRTE